MKEIVKRLQKQTPKFFVKLRNASVTLAAISAAILTAPVALPAALVKLAGFMAVAGAVAGAVSQTAVKNEKR